VAFPFEPEAFSTVVGLVVDVARAGGYVTTVSVWDGDRWQEYSQRGSLGFGQDFPVEIGKAYFLRNHKQVEWSVSGVVSETPVELALQRGWNGVGIPVLGFNAGNVLDEINLVGVGEGQQVIERATEIDRWRSGFWDPFVKRIFAEDDVQEYGDNFQIEMNRGYMIQVKEEVLWKP